MLQVWSGQLVAAEVQSLQVFELGQCFGYGTGQLLKLSGQDLQVFELSAQCFWVWYRSTR